MFLAACGQVPGGTISDADRGREIEFAVWLPDIAERVPLIVLSHGSGGHYRNFEWLTKILNTHGYAVAAVNHPFNTVGDNTPEGIARAWDRPPDISALIDEILGSAEWSSAIDVSRIGAAGFSSGGYTVLGLAGAIYDIQQMREYCDSSRRGPECELSSALPDTDSSASSSMRDPRIGAIFSMAPGWGAAINQASLERIEVPVKIVATEDDEWLISETNAEYFHHHIRNSELMMLPRGGHFLFLSCDPMTRVADWFISQFNLCGVGINVDRESRQVEIANLAVAFFDENLKSKSTAL